MDYMVNEYRMVWIILTMNWVFLAHIDNLHFFGA